MRIKVILEKGEDGYFVARCPSLKSCWSQGKTREEALQNIREAVELYLEPAPDQLPKDDKAEVVELAGNARSGPAGRVTPPCSGCASRKSIVKAAT